MVGAEALRQRLNRLEAYLAVLRGLDDIEARKRVSAGLP